MKERETMTETLYIVDVATYTLKSTIKNLSPYILKDEIEYTR